MLKSNMVNFPSPEHHTMLCQQIFEQLSGPFHLPGEWPHSGNAPDAALLGIFMFYVPFMFFLGIKNWGGQIVREIYEIYWFGQGFPSQNVLRSLIFDSPRRHRFDEVEMGISNSPLVLKTGSLGARQLISTSNHGKT